jgi:putative DNA primase/helicase
MRASNTSITAKFRHKINQLGYEAPVAIKPGQYHRFPGLGKRASNRAGWCRLFPDLAGGVIGDFSIDFHEVWWVSEDKLYRTALPKTYKAQDDQLQRRMAAERASHIWRRSILPSPHHPYLVKKQIKPYLARQHHKLLVLPIMDLAGNLTSLQFIDEIGTKCLLKDGKKKGCFIPVVYSQSQMEMLIVCEGWATGCTLAEVNPQANVIAAIDAGNIRSISTDLRCRYPSAEILIAGDDDRLTDGNPGRSKAMQAATATGSHVIFPRWPAAAPLELTDFNDLAVWYAGGHK